MSLLDRALRRLHPCTVCGDKVDQALSILADMELQLREAIRLITQTLAECPCRGRPGVVILQDRCPRCRDLAEALHLIAHTL